MVLPQPLGPHDGDGRALAASTSSRRRGLRRRPLYCFEAPHGHSQAQFLEEIVHQALPPTGPVRAPVVITHPASRVGGVAVPPCAGVATPASRRSQGAIHACRPIRRGGSAATARRADLAQLPDVIGDRVLPAPPRRAERGLTRVRAASPGRTGASPPVTPRISARGASIRWVGHRRPDPPREESARRPGESHVGQRQRDLLSLPTLPPPASGCDLGEEGVRAGDRFGNATDRRPAGLQQHDDARRSSGFSFALSIPVAMYAFVLNR